MNSVLDVFDRSLAIFEDKTRWAKGYYQYDEDGNKSTIADGYSYCALGVLQHVVYLVYSPTAFMNESLSYTAQCLLQRVSVFLYGKYIQEINDYDPDGYNKVVRTFQFAKEFWKNEKPSVEDLSVPIEKILQRRAKVK